MHESKLIIVVPCYNEQEMLDYTTDELLKVIDRLRQDGKIGTGKILYVDDGSKDATWSIIERLTRRHEAVCGLKLAHNVGHQNALWAGLEWASLNGDVSISIDADLQDDTRAIDEWWIGTIRGRTSSTGCARTGRPTPSSSGRPH